MWESVGFKKILGNIGNAIKEANEERKERNRIKQQEEDEIKRIAEQELQAKIQLLEKFEFPKLKQLCKDVLGREPQDKYYDDKKTGQRHKLESDRHDYVEFIVDDNQGFTLSQIEAFALKNGIIYPNFFASQSSQEQEKKEFENIMNTISSQFQPEKIYGETEFEDQLFIFLKAKFPSRKIVRQFVIKEPDQKLDILIDDKYAFELKVYDNRNQLRDLGAQLEEYKERYPYLCAVILDPVQTEASEANIREYTDKYKTKNGVMTINLKGIKKG